MFIYLLIFWGENRQNRDFYKKKQTVVKHENEGQKILGKLTVLKNVRLGVTRKNRAGKCSQSWKLWTFYDAVTILCKSVFGKRKIHKVFLYFQSCIFQSGHFFPVILSPTFFNPATFTDIFSPALFSPVSFLVMFSPAFSTPVTYTLLILCQRSLACLVVPSSQRL